jgi:signal transduction histidine kinase
MKTAQGSITLDTSSFEKSIETAKSKLASLVSMLAKIVTAILAVVGAMIKFKEIVGVVDSAIKAFRVFQDIFSSGGNRIGKVMEILKTKISEMANEMKDSFTSISDFAGKAFDAIRSKNASLPPVLKKTNSSFKEIINSIVIFSGAGLALKATFTILTGTLTLFGSLVGKIFDGVTAVFKVVVNIVQTVLVSAFKILTSALKGVVVGILAVGTAFATLTAIIAKGVAGVFEMGDQLKTNRDITGASIPFLMQLQKAFKQAGLSAEEVVPVISNMNRAISEVDAKGQPSNKSLLAMGANIKELQKLSADDALKQIGLDIQKVGNQGLKTAYSMDIFGKQGRYLLGVFSDTTSIAKLGTNLDASSKTMAENADRFARISAALKDSGTFFRGFFIQIAGAVAPQLERLIAMLNTGDFMTDLGTKIGAKLKIALDIFAGAIDSGKISEALKSALLIPVIYFQDLFARSMEAGKKFIKAITTPQKFSLLANDLQINSVLSILGSSLARLFKSVAKLFGTLLIDGLQTPLAALEVLLQNIAVSFGINLVKAIANAFAPKFVKDAFRALGMGDMGDILSQTAKAMGIKRDPRSMSERIKEQEQNNRTNGVLDFGQGTIADNLSEVQDRIGNVGQKLITVLMEARQQIEDMGDMSIENKLLIEQLQKELEEYRKRGEALVRKDEQPQGGKTSEKGTAVFDSKLKDSAVSSLQRIGGGGGAFGGDPLLELNRQQLKEQKESNSTLKQIAQSTSPKGYASFLMPSGETAVFTNG